MTGVDALVHGSDRPNAEPTDPGLGEAFSHALSVANPQRLLTGGAAEPPRRSLAFQGAVGAAP